MHLIEDTPLTLPEELLLLCVRDDGRVPRAGVDLDAALAAAELDDAVLRGHVRVIDDRLVRDESTGAGPLDPDVERALQGLPADVGTLGVLVWRSSRRARRRYLDRLVRRGLLRRRTPRGLARLAPARFDVAAPAVRDELLTRVRGALTSVDAPRDRALLVLLHVAGLLEEVLGPVPPEARARLQAGAAADPAAAAVDPQTLLFVAVFAS